MDWVKLRPALWMLGTIIVALASGAVGTMAEKGKTRAAQQECAFAKARADSLERADELRRIIREEMASARPRVVRVREASEKSESRVERTEKRGGGIPPWMIATGGAIVGGVVGAALSGRSGDVIATAIASATIDGQAPPSGGKQMRDRGWGHRRYSPWHDTGGKGSKKKHSGKSKGSKKR